MTPNAPGSEPTSPPAPPTAGTPQRGLRRPQRRARAWDRGVRVALFLAASVAVLATAGIVYTLVTNSLPFFREVSVWAFLTGTQWSPQSGRFGVVPLVLGTLMVTLGSALVAVPLGVATAVYLSEFARPRVRAVLKPALEILAGIPSIAFGLFAVLVISPLVQEHLGGTVFNALNAVIVLSFMVLPIISSISEDALRAVPREMRAAALALGATKWETTKQVVVPAALSGIVAGVLLGFGRAIGETMAVLLAAGGRPQFGFNFLEPILPMTAYIAQRAQGDVAHSGPVYFSLFAVGLLLFLITFLINLLAARFVERYREQSE